MEKLIRSMLIARTAGAVAERAGKIVRRAIAVIVCTILAGIFAGAAFGCAMAALWIVLLPQIGPVLAPLAVCGLLLVLALALLLTSQVVARRKVSGTAAAGAAGDPLAALATDALRLVREHKGAMLLSAVLAGLIIGRKR